MSGAEAATSGPATQDQNCSFVRSCCATIQSCWSCDHHCRAESVENKGRAVRVLWSLCSNQQSMVIACAGRIYA